MTKKERQQRIIARGEHSNHCHVITGDVKIIEVDNELIIEVGEDSNASLRHLLETEWLKGKEVRTNEHGDIPLKKGTYKFVQQQEYDPFGKIIRKVID